MTNCFYCDILSYDDRNLEKYLVFKFQNNVNQYLNEIKFEISQFDEENNLIAKSIISHGGFYAKENEVFVPNYKLKAEKEDLCLIVIDYIGIVTLGNSKITDRQQIVAEISRGIKSLARELEVPIIALSQLSRDIEKRKTESKAPMLSDIRDSGAIEQDADVIIFIQREDRLGAGGKDAEKAELPVVLTNLAILKHRNGALGNVPVMFCKEFAEFNSVNDEEYAKLKARDGE